MNLHSHRSAVFLADWIIEKLSLSASYDQFDFYRDRLIQDIKSDGAVDWFKHYKKLAD
jgi:hypothetical protein